MILCNLIICIKKCISVDRIYYNNNSYNTFNNLVFRVNKKHINSHIQNWNMTMNCPVCGAIMIWLNGSISHDPPIKYYECRVCNINVTKQPDGSYETVEAKNKSNNKKTIN
jgi:transcription elongation factor Elf1